MISGIILSFHLITSAITSSASTGSDSEWGTDLNVDYVDGEFVYRSPENFKNTAN